MSQRLSVGDGENKSSHLFFSSRLSARSSSRTSSTLFPSTQAASFAYVSGFRQVERDRVIQLPHLCTRRRHMFQLGFVGSGESGVSGSLSTTLACLTDLVSIHAKILEDILNTWHHTQLMRVFSMILGPLVPGSMFAAANRFPSQLCSAWTQGGTRRWSHTWCHGILHFISTLAMSLQSWRSTWSPPRGVEPSKCFIISYVWPTMVLTSS